MRKEKSLIGTNDRLKHHYHLRDWLFYVALITIPFLTALIAVGSHSISWLGIYLAICLGGIAMVLRFFCTRCPHYMRKGNTLNCLFFRGLPKFFAPRPGKLNFLDIAVTLGVSAVVVLFPIYWLVGKPVLLIIYGLSVAVAIIAVRRMECERCIYFACPMNAVQDAPERTCLGSELKNREDEPI
jgi:hypothetical protein